MAPISLSPLCLWLVINVETNPPSAAATAAIPFETLLTTKTAVKHSTQLPCTFIGTTSHAQVDKDASEVR